MKNNQPCKMNMDRKNGSTWKECELERKTRKFVEGVI
jgi:hypothetical protein